MGTYSKEIEELEKKLKELKKKEEEEKREKENKPEYFLAKKLHSLLCHSNHTDMCSWEYEKGDSDCWSRFAHAQYLELAEKLLLIESDVDKIIQMADLIAHC